MTTKISSKDFVGIDDLSSKGFLRFRRRFAARASSTNKHQLSGTFDASKDVLHIRKIKKQRLLVVSKASETKDPDSYSSNDWPHWEQNPYEPEQPREPPKQIAYTPPPFPHPLYLLVLDARDSDCLPLAERCIDSGSVNAIMLSGGGTSDQHLTSLAVELQDLCRRRNINFIMDSRLGVAAAVLADGVQLADTEEANRMPLYLVRNFLEQTRVASGQGLGKVLLGRPVHSVGDARLAQSGGADYVLLKRTREEGSVTGDDAEGGSGSSGDQAGDADGDSDGAAESKSKRASWDEAEEASQETEVQNQQEQQLVESEVEVQEQEEVEEVGEKTSGESSSSSSSGWTNEAVDPIAVLQGIRKDVGLMVVVTDEFCNQPGVNVNKVLSTGADGFQIPAAQFREMFRAQDNESHGPSKMLPTSSPRLIGATLLVAGSTLGAGALTMPVKTMAAGFLPSVVGLVTCWACMVATALLLVEMNIWFGPKANLETMALKTLGGKARQLVILLYTLTHSFVLAVYIGEGSKLLAPFLGIFGPLQGPSGQTLIALMLTAGVASVVQGGTTKTERMATCTLGITALAFTALLTLSGVPAYPQNFFYSNWVALTPAIPIMVVAFTFHNVVPSLLRYLGNARDVAKAVIIGSAIPLMGYIWFQYMVIVNLPIYDHSTSFTSLSQVLIELAGTGRALTTALSIQVFGLGCIVTSFLGVTLGYMDFVMDLVFRTRETGFSKLHASVVCAVKEPWMRRSFSLGLILIPSFVMGVCCPAFFVNLLEISGLARLFLFGVLPSIMIARGRQQGYSQWLPGETIILVVISGLAILVAVQYGLLLLK